MSAARALPADPAKAAHWYEMAANQGNRKAMHNLAVSYASGSHGGKKNMAEAGALVRQGGRLGTVGFPVQSGRAV